MIRAKHTEVLNVRVTPEVKAWLQQEAETWGGDVSDVVRDVLTDAMRKAQRRARREARREEGGNGR